MLFQIYLNVQVHIWKIVLKTGHKRDDMIDK